MRGGPVRLRRARTVQVHWHLDVPVFENYLTRVSIEADEMTFHILDFFSKWKKPESLCAHFPQYTRSSVLNAIKQLTSHTLLVEKGSPEVKKETLLLKTWSRWLPEGSFHFATKNPHFIPQKARMEVLRRQLPTTPQPAFFKEYKGSSRVKLPTTAEVDGEFVRVLKSRRTHRIFSPGAITLEDVSQILALTWGVQGHVFSKLFGRLPLKTSPSGGARHPGEVYVAAMDVEGLRPGLYHYHPVHHHLSVIHQGPMRKKALQYCVGQKHTGEAAVLFLMTAVFPRSMYKYHQARAYRVVTLDAGHLCQTFCLVATWLGLAPFSTAALKDTLIEKDLGLDGITESVLYVAGAGLPLAGIMS